MAKKSALEEIHDQIVKHIPKVSKSVEIKEEVVETKPNLDHLQGHTSRDFKNVKKDG